MFFSVLNIFTHLTTLLPVGSLKPILKWLTLGLWGFALGSQGCLETNMLVYAMQRGRVGGLTNVMAQCEWFRGAVEYRLKG